MKIYTKTGDQGRTSLVGGKRVPKTDLRIEAYGTVDELIAVLGLLREMDIKKDVSDFLYEVQNQLMITASILATDNQETLNNLPELPEKATISLENAIDQMTEELVSLNKFVIPGGSKAAATCHLARTVCRRAERSVLHIHPFFKEYNPVEKYLNRLSDYLFVLARKILKDQNRPEVLWSPR